MSKCVSIYMDDNAIRLLDHLYVLRIINKRKTTRSRLVAEALTMLADKEQEQQLEVD